MVQTRSSLNGVSPDDINSKVAAEGRSSEKEVKVANNSELSERDANRTSYIVFLSLIIDLLAFTLILPLLPSLLDYYGTHDQVRLD